MSSLPLHIVLLIAVACKPKAQGHCLVMTENEVSAESKHGIVDGHFVYVCCPPCVKKMTAAPAKYLPKLDDLYDAFLKK